MRRLSKVLLVLLLAATPLPALAQDPPSLEGIQELARLGRTEEARLALTVWWETAREGAARRDLQRALWLRGTLTVDPQQATLDFRRLIVEYPGGPFSDRALYRLAQTAFASGYPQEARTYVATLSRDYPASPVREEAVAWLARVSDRTGLVDPRPQVGDSAGAAADPAVETRPPPADVPEEEVPEEVTTPPTTPPSQTDSTPATRASRRFGVQLGAFSNDDLARALYRRAQDAGLEPRLVRVEGSRLLHVRIGTYDSAGDAGELLERVRGMGFVAALVRDVNQEERIRR